MAPVRGHVEEDSGVPHCFFASGDRETGEEANGCNLEAGRCQEHGKGRGDVKHKYIHLYTANNSITVGEPPAHI